MAQRYAIYYFKAHPLAQMAIFKIQLAPVFGISFSSSEGEKHIYQAMLQRPNLSFALDASITV